MLSSLNGDFGIDKDLQIKDKKDTIYTDSYYDLFCIR